MKNSLACGGVASCFKMSLMVVCPETSNSFFLGLFESGNATTHFRFTSRSMYIIQKMSNASKDEGL